MVAILTDWIESEYIRVALYPSMTHLCTYRKHWSVSHAAFTAFRVLTDK